MCLFLPQTFIAKCHVNIPDDIIRSKYDCFEGPWNRRALVVETGGRSLTQGPGGVGYSATLDARPLRCVNWRDRSLFNNSREPIPELMCTAQTSAIRCLQPPARGDAAADG